MDEWRFGRNSERKASERVLLVVMFSLVICDLFKAETNVETVSGSDVKEFFKI